MDFGRTDLFVRELAGRLAARLLNAIEMPELISSSIQEYKKLYIAIGHEPQRVRVLKEKLAHNKLTMPLFKSTMFTIKIKTIYKNLVITWHKSTSKNLI